MIIFPAIDIKDGKVVRLSQGKFDEITIYSHDPVETARRWEIDGATWLHIIDLDGAETGAMKNIGMIIEIAKSVKIPVQVGGGIRTSEHIEKLLSSGVTRVILGTKAIEDKEFFRKTLAQLKNRVITSLDCSRGIVTIKGWTSISNLKATEFAKELQEMGLSNLIYTDIARDGTLRGPNIASIKELLAAVNIPVIASGGISELEDIKKLKELETSGLVGIIVGKALYEERFDLKSALKLC